MTAYRTKMRSALLWPAALIVVARVSPLSWVYHYMTAFAFLPVLVDRWGIRGAILTLVCLAPSSLAFAILDLQSLTPANTVMLANSGILVLVAAFFVLATDLKDAVRGRTPVSARRATAAE